MKKIFLVFFVVSVGLCGNANAEICIAGRCTDTTSIGSISVSSVNGSWDCSGSGCASFERQVQPLHVGRLNSIQSQVQNRQPQPGEIVQLRLKRYKNNRVRIINNSHEYYPD